MAAPDRPPWTLDDLFSTARLVPYLTACNGDQPAALGLYDWNVQISSAFHESMHYLEVGLRNAMDRQLTAWASSLGATAPWYVDPVVPLTTQTRDKVAEARRNATRGGISETHGKVIAELTFGFWWALLAAPYNRSLWQPCLRYAFDGPVRRDRLHDALDSFRLLRNRIAHHEPIHTRNLAADHALLHDTAGRISPLQRARIEATSRVPAVLTLRPAPPTAEANDQRAVEADGQETL